MDDSKFGLLFIGFFALVLFVLASLGNVKTEENKKEVQENKKEDQEHRVMVRTFYGLISIVLFLVGVAIKMAINLNENKGWRYKIFEKDTTINVMIVSIVVAIGLSIYIYRNQPPKKN